MRPTWTPSGWDESSTDMSINFTETEITWSSSIFRERDAILALKHGYLGYTLTKNVSSGSHQRPALIPLEFIISIMKRYKNKRQRFFQLIK